MTTNRTHAPTITDADRAAAQGYADAAERAAGYGVDTSMGMLTAETVAARRAIDHSQSPTWVGDRDLVKVTVVRLLGFTDYDSPGCELSYCYGELADGTPVRVDLGRFRFDKARWKSQLIGCFKDAGRYAKGMGVDVNDPASVSRL